MTHQSANTFFVLRIIIAAVSTAAKIKVSALYSDIYGITLTFVLEILILKVKIQVEIDLLVFTSF